MTTNAMGTWVEVWPIAADQSGLWLLSGDAGEPKPWLSDEPVPSDSQPWWHMEELLRDHDASDAKVMHMTSSRWQPGRQIDTFIAVYHAAGDVLDRWRNATPIDLEGVAASGKPAPHAADEQPETIADTSVLWHALRHLKKLCDPDGDAPTRSATPMAVRAHLRGLQPALAGMYETPMPAAAAHAERDAA